MANRVGRFKVRFAEGEADVRSAQALRYRTFIEGRDTATHGDRLDGLDTDEFDSICRHVLVERAEDGKLICCFRILPMANGSEVARSYSAKYYDLSALESFEGSMVEMGRFCIDPEYRGDADVIRIAWGAMTAYVDDEKVDMLFGCSSFHGTDAEQYMDAFALLKERHLAPNRWLPRIKAPRVFRYAANLKLRKPNMKLAMRGMPPLLRTYLVMGGWVSDHAVVDNDLNTLHVFTGLEVGKVPAGRARFLRASAT